jgi:hypothetical protein
MISVSCQGGSGGVPMVWILVIVVAAIATVAVLMFIMLRGLSYIGEKKRGVYFFLSMGDFFIKAIARADSIRIIKLIKLNSGTTFEVTIVT